MDADRDRHAAQAGDARPVAGHQDGRRATSTCATAPSRRCSTSISTSPSAQVTALIGPSGCGKSTFLRCLNRMNDTIDGCRVEGEIRLDGDDIYDARHRRGAAARPRRHGVPEAQPVPEVDLRERRLRPAHPRARHAARPSWTRSSRRPAAAPACGTRSKDRLDAARHRPVRRPAAAPVHRPRHRRQPRGDPDGRAVLGARPDRHRPYRGADRRAARRTTRSSSSPTTCSRRRACRSAPPSSISAS